MTDSPAFRELPRLLFAILFIALAIVASLWILRPFLPALVWSTLIVVSTWPLLLGAQRHLWGKRSLAVAVMTAALLLVVVLPLVAAVLAIADNASDVAGKVKALTAAGVPGPPAWVQQIPLVGSSLSTRWADVAALSPDDLRARAGPHVASAAGWVLARAGGLAMFLLHVLLTVVIAVLLYATGERAEGGLRAFAVRLAGQRGNQSVTLAGQAIRAVAVGVVATAVLQAVLGGIGLAVAGVPFAAALTIVMFVLGVAQIGAAPVLLFGLGWLYWNGHTWTAAAFLPWAVFAGAIDNVVRPILIKRGADLPFVLIFAGVVGGLLAFGVVGLFIGPLVLAIAYTELGAWIADTGPGEQLPLATPGLHDLELAQVVAYAPPKEPAGIA